MITTSKLAMENSSSITEKNIWEIMESSKARLFSNIYFTASVKSILGLLLVFEVHHQNRHQFIILKLLESHSFLLLIT